MEKSENDVILWNVYQKLDGSSPAFVQASCQFVPNDTTILRSFRTYQEAADWRDDFNSRIFCKDKKKTLNLYRSYNFAGIQEYVASLNIQQDDVVNVERVGNEYLMYAWAYDKDSSSENGWSM